ncbi:MAG: two-component system chemotaxis response regulator CheY [Alphaproteobacteria bacterium]|jgi:two-component system chemotaxis response regulator CheY
MVQARSMKVLVVDDQQSMRGLARQCLTRIGVRQVDMVPSAEDALKSLEKSQFDLIISDLNMDGMSGTDLLDKVREHPILKEMPFLLATSECYRPEEGLVDKSGFVAKPFSVADLKSAIEGVLGKLS